MSALDRMLDARSVAIVGASERPGSVGDHTVRQLVKGGFAGEVHLVNPRYERLHGRPCHPSLDEVGEVDHVVLAVGNASLERELERAVAVGVGSATIFASCHGEGSDGTALRDRLRSIAADTPVCGGNGMGFLNVERRLRVCGFHQPYDLAPGGVTFLSHSGSLFSAMLHNRGRLRFNLVVSTGLELNTTMDRYMAWALDRESTAVLALFLETVRDPTGFRAALALAEERDVPVVALKVGSSELGRRAAATHSEAIAGDDAAYEAIFASHGVHRVRTMDEMMDTVELFASGRRAATGGLGAVHDSGGERTMLIDAAERIGVPLPAVSVATSAAIGAVLDPGLEPANPVDAWGTGRDAESVFATVMTALAGDDAIGAVTFSVDLTAEESPDDAYANAATSVAAATDKPVFVLANVSSAVDPEQAAALRAAGVPVLQGTDTGLTAVRAMFDHLAHRTMPPLQRRTTGRQAPGRGVWDEWAALALVASYGIAVPEMRRCSTADEAVAAGDALGHPVVMKTTVPGIAHKSDVGGVALGLASAVDIRRAHEAMAARLGPDVVVAATAAPGIEVAFGMVHDPQFGPIVIVTAGGVLIEALPGRVAALPPLDRPRASRLLARLPLMATLEQHRRRGALDITALEEALVRFSELAADAAAWADAIDVNPLIVGTTGCTAVDALVVPR